MRIFVAHIMLSLWLLIPHTSNAQETVFSHASCTIIYSLERSADKYFNDGVEQLSNQINKKNIHFIDLNNWGKAPPYLEVSGRFRNQLRKQYGLKKGINHVVIVDEQGQELIRYTGSVTLVEALLNCR